MSSERLGDAVLYLRTDDTALDSGLESAHGKAEAAAERFQRIGGRMQSIGAGLSVAVTAPLVMFGTQAFQAASDASELQSAFDQTFKGMEASMNSWAEQTGDSMGRSTQEMQRAANTLGMLFNAAAPTRAEAAALSQQFAVLAQDLSSFFNVDPAEALAKLRSGLAGESEPLRDFGVFLTEAAVKARALEMGLVAVGGELTEQQKIMARASLIMEQTSVAHVRRARRRRFGFNAVAIVQRIFRDRRAYTRRPIRDCR